MSIKLHKKPCGALNFSIRYVFLKNLKPDIYLKLLSYVFSNFSPNPTITFATCKSKQLQGIFICETWPNKIEAVH